jgi:predicted ATPase
MRSLVAPGVRTLDRGLRSSGVAPPSAPNALIPAMTASRTDKSLVLAEGDPIPRYRLLETTRAFALEQLAESGETAPMLRHHAKALLALLAPFERHDRLWAIAKARATGVQAELDHLGAALTWLGTVSDRDDLAEGATMREAQVLELAFGDNAKRL